MGIVEAIASGLKLAWAVVTGRNAAAERKNSPAMQANAVARVDAEIKQEATTAVAKADLAKIQELGAE